MLRRFACLVLAVGIFYGCAPKAHLAATPASWDFGKVLVGTTASKSPGASWKNDSQKSTSISALEMSGADAASFGSDPRTMVSDVGSGETTQSVRSVTFAPVKRGTHKATLTPLVDKGTADGVALSGSGEYVFRDGDFAVMEGGPNVPPDDEKPLNCGRVPYTTPKTCSFDIRNDSPAAVNAAITLTPGGGAFAVTTPASSPVAIAKGATQTITITFTPPTRPPLETLFTGGVVVSAGTNSVGRALCGIGFRNPTASEAPPPGTKLAPLACP